MGKADLNKKTEIDYTGCRLGIMQPYFFPYLGYFSLIANTERWIVFDPVQYIRKGWVNRNRVLKPGGGWKYVSIAVGKHSRETLIKDMQVAPDTDHMDALIRNLDYYRNARAPHYQRVIDLLRDCYEPKPEGLTDFLTASLERTCLYLGIPFRYEVYSKAQIEHETASAPGEWALNICKAVGATSYVNPPGGQAIFDPSRFESAGVQLMYLQQNLRPYPQRTTTFEPGLSIIDAMMFNEPEAIKDMLADHELVTPSP